MTEFGNECESKRRKWNMTQGTEKSKRVSERASGSATSICKSEGTSDCRGSKKLWPLLRVPVWCLMNFLFMRGR
jgi:hypothetical protein